MDDDKLIGMLLDLVIEKEAEKPKFPDTDVHGRSEAELHARRYDEWEIQIWGLKRMIGIRLCEAALQARKDG